MESSANIVYRDLTDFDLAWKFTAKHFITREPWCSTLQLNPHEGYLFGADYVKDGCSQGVSIGAFDQEHDKLIGYSINLLGTLSEDHTVPLLDEDSPLRTRQAQEAMRCALGLNLKETMGTAKYLEISFLCVDPQYTHYGIGSNLVKRSIEIARKNGAKRVVLAATSAYTNKISRKLGFYEEHSTAYVDYVDPITKEKVFENMAEPHKCLYRLVLDL